MNDRLSAQANSATMQAGDYPRIIAGTRERSDKIALTADWILLEFAAYYSESRHIPELAKKAFEERDHATSLALSMRRLALYSSGISELGVRLREALPSVSTDAGLWQDIEQGFLLLIQGRYEADLAFAFINSVKRRIHQGEWQPVEYSFQKADKATADYSGDI